MTCHESSGVLRGAAMLFGLLLGALFAVSPATTAQDLVAKAAKSQSTADHSKFKELQGPFANGSEVTKACLACHTEAAKQLHKTTHWKWEFYNELTKQKLGKRTVVNNFCVAVATNWPRCSKASAVGARLDLERLPVSGELAHRHSRADCERLVLFGGDDYELLFTMPSDRADAVAGRAPGGVPVHRIGVIEGGSGVRCERDGRVEELRGGGYDHFA